MARFPTCIYGSAQDRAGVCANVAASTQRLHDQVAAQFDGRIDGYNLSSALAGSGISFSTQTSTTPKKIVNSIADTSEEAYIRTKKDAALVVRGLEAVTDGTDTVYGRFCWVSSDDLSKQVGSAIVESPVVQTNPKFTVYANYGKGRFGTSAAFDTELHRNGTAELTLDGTVGAVLTNGLAQKFGTAYKFTFAGTPAASDKTHTLPNRTGGIVLAPSALTALYVPRADSNGDLVDGPLVYEAGSTGSLYNSRTAFVIGAAASSVLFPKIKRSADGIAIVDADNLGGAPTFVQAKTFKLHTATAALYTVSLEAASAPAANRTITFPPRDGGATIAPSALTANTVPRADSNGDLVDSGITDDGTTLSVSRVDVLGTNASGFTVGGSNNGTNGIPTVFHGGNGAAGGNGAKATLRGGDAIGTDKTGGNLDLRAGVKTGTGAHGVLDIQHADATTRIKIDASGNTLFTGVQGTSGKVAVFTSTGSLTSGQASGGTLIGRYVLTSGTTHTTQAGTTKIRVYLQAGGGGGGGGASLAASASVGGGGSAGAYGEKDFTVTGSTGYTYAIGAAGAAGANTGGNGGAGGNTTFAVDATTATALGGNGGVGDTGGTVNAFNSGGAPPEGATNVDFDGGGAPGHFAIRFTGLIGASGTGGSSAFGAGGLGKATTNPGSAGKGHGAGGSGACVLNGGTAALGGAGTAGIIVVDEFS